MGGCGRPFVRAAAAQGNRAARDSAPLAQIVMPIAAVGFYIYLFNIFPIYLTDQILREPLGRFWLLQIALSLVLGLIVYAVLERSRPFRAKMRARWARA